MIIFGPLIINSVLRFLFIRPSGFGLTVQFKLNYTLVEWAMRPWPSTIWMVWAPKQSLQELVPSFRLGGQLKSRKGGGCRLGDPKANTHWIFSQNRKISQK